MNRGPGDSVERVTRDATPSPSPYERAGVDSQREALSAVVRHLEPTLRLPDTAEVLTSFGHYAAVLKVHDELAIAICTDSVGSKVLVASALDRYDTVGFDCMAMNVNDLICVGARPIAFVDYLGVNSLDSTRTDAILKGLAEAAREAGVAIPGGEVAQLPDLIGAGTSGSDEKAFDLVGTCIGTLHPKEIILGDAVRDGDAILGLVSSGLHSNGYTLARRVLFEDGGYDLADDIPALGCTLGDELLRPTMIYVRAVKALWDQGVETRGLAHITGDGLTNLCRLAADVGYFLSDPPEPPPVFDLIQQVGNIPDTEMYRVFNMGVGFVVVVAEELTGRALEALGAEGYDARLIGTVGGPPRTVDIPGRGLRGGLVDGESYFETR